MHSEPAVHALFMRGSNLSIGEPVPAACVPAVAGKRAILGCEHSETEERLGLQDAEGVLRAGEQAARCAALGAIVMATWGEAKILNFTTSRRLALAASKSNVPVFIPRAAAKPSQSAAATRWSVRSAPSRPLEATAPGCPAFDVTLLRHRGGMAGQSWRVEWIVTKNVSGIKSTPEPRRYLALWFPFLPTDRLQQEHLRSHGAEQDDRPRVAVEKIKGALRITAVDPRALKLGLTKGLILADARARISDIAVTSSDLQEDQRFLAYLADVCHRFTQSVALDFADGLMLDITGCAHLFDGEGHLRKRIITRLGHIGLNVRACIAGTPDAARALARYSTFEIVPPGHDEVHVKRLPVRALAAIEQDAVIALTRAGLKKLGDLSERPSHVLAARFGQNLVTCLMRTLGREDARITPLRPVFAGGPAVIAGSSPIFAANAQPGSPPNFLVVGYWGGRMSHTSALSPFLWGKRRANSTGDCHFHWR